MNNNGLPYTTKHRVHNDGINKLFYTIWGKEVVIYMVTRCGRQCVSYTCYYRVIHGYYTCYLFSR